MRRIGQTSYHHSVLEIKNIELQPSDSNWIRINVFKIQRLEKY
jgi:hypothetical protein